jgi:hypothetical protein
MLASFFPRLLPVAAAVCLSLLPMSPAPRPIQAGTQDEKTTAGLKPGESVPLTVRWVVEDGYYLDEKTTSSVAFVVADGLSVTPGKVETSGRVVGMQEQKATLSVSASALGRIDLKGNAVIFFCSVREQWCKRVTRTVSLPVRVSADAVPPAGGLELELPIPLGDERD